MRIKLSLTLMALLLVTVSAFAQRRGGELFRELELTTEQQTQVEAIRKDTRAKLEELRANGKGREANREQARAIMKEGHKASLAVLTPEQRDQLKAKKEDRQAAWKAVDKNALRAELKAYRETEIEPVLRAARGQLDRYISAEDQQEIERLRAVFADRPKARDRGERPADRPERGEREKLREQHKAAAREWREEHRADIEALKELTTSYQTELERAAKSLEGRRATWRKETKAIRDKYLPEGRRPGKANRKAGKDRKQSRHGDDRIKAMKAGAFLLMRS